MSPVDRNDLWKYILAIKRQVSTSNNEWLSADYTICLRMISVKKEDNRF